MRLSPTISLNSNIIIFIMIILTVKFNLLVQEFVELRIRLAFWLRWNMVGFRIFLQKFLGFEFLVEVMLLYIFSLKHIQFKYITILMRKKQNAENVFSRKDLEQLERKLEEQKMILVKENKKLQSQIYKEIEEANMNKIIYEKNKQISDKKIEQLGLEIERMRVQLLKKVPESDSEDEEELSMLKVNRDVILQNSELKLQIKQYVDVILNLETDNKKLKDEAEREVQELKLTIQQLQENFHIIKEESYETRRQLEEKISQVQGLVENTQKLEEKLKQSKKKKKETENSLDTIEKRMKNFEMVEMNKLETQISELKKVKEEQDNEKISLNRKIDFLEVEIKQKNSCIEAINKQVYELKETILDKENEMNNKITCSENENRRYIIEIQNLKSKIIKQSEQFEKSLQAESSSIKKKVAEEIYNYVKSNEQYPQKIQVFMEGLRGCKSQNHIRAKMHDDKKQINFEKFKFENQISNLENEINSLKKHNQALNEEILRLSKVNEDKKDEVDDKDKKVKQLMLINDRNDHQKSLQIQRLRNQIINLKSKQTEILEMKKNQVEVEMAINEKMRFYEDKIQQKIQSIYRKDNTIESLKEKRIQLQNKTKFLEDKLAKVLEDVQHMKKLKSDCQRKDELMKDYKEKMERAKVESQNLKVQVEKLKKDKSRIQKNLQSKEEYINSLKNRVSREQEEQENKAKEEKTGKQIKEKYEGKLKKIRKDLDIQNGSLQSIRKIILEKIEESLGRSGLQTCKENNWEGAEVLGLQADQVEQFINPTVNLDKHICSDLVGFWQKGEYENFIINSLEYIILKNQKD